MYKLMHCVEISCVNLAAILIPIPDIRHLQRNIANQLKASPKKLITVGYCCCLTDLTNLMDKNNMSTFSFPNGFFNLTDKQNQDRADFLISDNLINLLSSKDECLGFVSILTAFKNVVTSIRSTTHNAFERLRMLAKGGFFFMLQHYYAIVQTEDRDYGMDHTFSKQTISAIGYLLFGLALGYVRLDQIEYTSLFLPYTLQEYKHEIFFSYARSTIGSNRNLNAM